ncbi:hypothetical protein LINPERHAP1_LOCUS20409 [Linum perenne]
MSTLEFLGGIQYIGKAWCVFTRIEHVRFCSYTEFTLVRFELIVEILLRFWFLDQFSMLVMTECFRVFNQSGAALNVPFIYRMLIDSCPPIISKTNAFAIFWTLAMRIVEPCYSGEKNPIFFCRSALADKMFDLARL